MTVYRAPTLAASGVLLVGLALLLGVQPYSVTSTWSRFDEPGDRYVEAALRRDVSTLRRLSVSQQPVDWAIRAELTERSALAAWAKSARASVGFSRGDTVDVLYDTSTNACPFLLSFVGRHHPKVVRAHARCYIRRGWPTDPSVITVSP